MDFESLYSFLVVARSKSISKAAKHLHVTQPALSLRIRNLESELGFPLFERDWKGIKLTNQGRYFLKHTLQFLDDFSNCLTVLTHDRNNFKVSLQESTDPDKMIIGLDPWLVPLTIKPLLDELSRIREIKYQLITRPTAILLKLLEDETIHLAVFYTENIQPDKKDEVTFPPVPPIRDNLVLLHSTAVGEEIKPDLSNIAVIKEKPFLLFDHPVLVYHGNITAQIIKQLEINHFQLIDDVNVMINMIAYNSGFTIVPKSCIVQHLKPIEKGELPIRLIEMTTKKMPYINIQIAFSQNNEKLAPKLVQMAHRIDDHIREVMGAGATADNFFMD